MQGLRRPIMCRLAQEGLSKYLLIIPHDIGDKSRVDCFFH